MNLYGIMQYLGFDPKELIQGEIDAGRITIRTNREGTLAQTMDQRYPQLIGLRGEERRKKYMQILRKKTNGKHTHHPELQQFKHNPKLYRKNYCRMIRGQPFAME
jgi:hypothetical protein